MVKPVALRCVAQVAKTVDLPISGIGSIYEWQDAVESMLVGADTVQVCSAVMENGYGIIKKFCEGLQGYLERKGMNSPTDLVGRSLPYFTEHKNLNRSRRMFAAVEQITCHRCGKCVTSCCDSGYQATRLGENAIPVVGSASCDGCGPCVQICLFRSMALVAKP